jgi:hypothetical protein
VLPSGLPEDWVFERDLPCPQCRYNLRMLHLPRCPECGTVFRWQALLHVGCPRCGQSLHDVDGLECPRCGLALNWERLLGEIDPARFRQYEYSRRPRRAAFGAWFGALRPRRFWANIRLESPPVVHRLRWLRRAGVILAVLGISASSVATWRGYFLHYFNWLSILALALTMPLVTMVALPRFTPTLARFRIRGDQLLRVTAYATAGMLWIGLLYLIGGLVVVLINWARGAPRFEGLYIDLENFFAAIPALLGSQHDLWWWQQDAGTALMNLALGTLLLALGFIWWWWFLYVALRRYLRLDPRNAIALFVSTQAIGLLVLLWWILEFTVPRSSTLQRVLVWLDRLLR